MSTLDSLQTLYSDSVLVLNSSISIGTVIEENQKNISEIYYSTISRGIFEFDSAQTVIIFDIAIQCPASGGKAVIYARNLYRVINDTIVFDNTACDSIELRMAQKKTKGEDIFIFPNPANLFFDAQVDLNENESYRYSLVYGTGKVCAGSKNIKKYLIRINTETLSEGIYVFSVIKSNGCFIRKKIVIIR